MATSLIAPRGRRRAADVCVDNVILKIAQRCNLDCTYCYVYNRGDHSWRDRPPIIADGVLRQLAQRIVEHCERHAMRSFTVELHGGEPLLVGKRRMQSLIDILRGDCAPIHLRLTMQTNGTLLDREWIDLFARNGLSFGVSVDGPPEFADRRRVMRDGSGGSTQRLLRILADLRASSPAFEDVFGGCLCVVNPDCDGAAVVDWFVEQGFSAFDFLLPDGNRVNVPQGWTGVEPYTRFLLSAFDRWFELGDASPTIRKFELMMMGLMGAEVPLDALGGDLRRLCVVESDGSIGVNDVARICGGEYSHDVLNIFDNALDEHVTRYRIAEVQRVCGTCQRCPHLASCGGGYLPHRFDGQGFDNPSLYCDALYALSERMTHALRAQLPSQVWVPDAPADVVHRTEVMQ
jgi:uncharacterized protein